MAAVLAGCGPVRVVASASGRVLWVTARESDAVVAVSADRLRSDPRRALLGYLPAGRFPRDISVAGRGQLLVANYMSGQLETVQSADLP